MIHLKEEEGKVSECEIIERLSVLLGSGEERTEL